MELSHVGELCSFDAFLTKYNFSEPALRDLAVIVRGADTNRLDLAPQAVGLLAVSLGLSHNFQNDHEMLQHGLILYDALLGANTSEGNSIPGIHEPMSDHSSVRKRFLRPFYRRVGEANQAGRGPRSASNFEHLHICRGRRP
ncbi:MAG: chromate resistance protein ChrB domain-containing protein [Gammaproteobacteria bacterium]